MNDLKHYIYSVFVYYAVLKKSFQTAKPREVIYRSYNYFNETKFKKVGPEV